MRKCAAQVPKGAAFTFWMIYMFQGLKQQTAMREHSEGNDVYWYYRRPERMDLMMVAKSRLEAEIVLCVTIQVRQGGTQQDQV